MGISAKIGEVVEGDEDTADLGNSLHQNSASKDTPEATKTSDSEDSDIDGEFPNIIHESLVAGKAGVQRGKRSGPQMKYVPPEETPEQRDARTIFIGNLAIEVAKKKVQRSCIFTG